MRVLSDAHDPERTLFERMLFHRRAAFLDGKAPAATLFSGPDYFAEQLGHRKIMDATCMIAAMINGDPDSEDHRSCRSARPKREADHDPGSRSSRGALQ